jgi:glycosyltransferase involved in cell wall biosynthesis
MTGPSHILMTADTVGGVWTYAMELSRGLVREGTRVSLATMGAPMTSDQRREARRAGVDTYESAYKLEWMEQPWADVDRAGEWLLDLSAKLQPDSIHLNNYAHGNLEWNAPVVMVGHSCVYSWWNAVHGSEAPAEWAEYRTRVRKGLQAAQMVVGVSSAILRELQHWYGIESGAVVYNGRAADAYQPAQHKDDIVLSTGRVWDAAKNITAVDEAAAIIRWPVYVAGEAQHPEGGRRTMQCAIPAGKLSAEDLRPLFARAAVYALPALYEPFGLSVLEAALSGCALVLGDIPSLREIWGEAAVFVPPSDHEALGLCVNSLIESRDLREELGRKARTRALSFTPERMVDDYLGIYSQARARFRAAREVATSCGS